MAISLKQMIDRFTKMEKAANETLAADPAALVGVESIPGAEHDAKVPEEAKKPDAEVAEGQPAGAASTSGAVVGGDAKPLNEGKLEMDEALLNPEKKPLISDDALSAKTANAHLVSLVNDLLADINGKTEKKAEKKAESCEKCGKEECECKGEEAKKADEGEKKANINKIALDDETIAKLAAAQAAFMNGNDTAKETIKQASAAVEARKLIKAACVKAAQEQGLDPAAADAAAENAMAAAGVAPEAPVAEAAPAEAPAAEAAPAEAPAAEAAPAEAPALPEDVTEEELATAIVDLVSSGELDPDTAKALVEEIAGDDGAAPTEDQAAEIIAQGLESGEITPEQAQEIAAAVESGDAGADEAAAVDAEAQGAADAEAAIQDAKDEAQGAADAAEAMKQAAAQIRSNTISKVASAIVAKRQTKQAAAQPGARILGKVASILENKCAEKQAAAASNEEAKYIAGFTKKATEMGVDPSVLAKYVLASQK